MAVTPTVISSDETYGYTEENPINVGGVYETGPLRKRQYLNCLLGPNGEEITYYREGSCCHFETPNGLLGIGLLDRFNITYPGLKEPIILFLNQYDYEKPMAPKGFTIKE
ncbi:2-dehydro-3-deoxyphosphooctonate aldolase [Candidatus Dependentiae bacterium]|nr:2-dehydro-3-deoxyphosphooctonate aldolase [Candidatus Dependentiae bacterium]